MHPAPKSCSVMKRRCSDAGEESAPGKAVHADTTAASGVPLRVLVVEDDALIGMLLGDMLEMMGHRVCATESSQAGAVAAAARCLPDIMLVDAQLGEGSGIAAVDEIIGRGFVPHVFATGDVRAVLALRPRAVVIEKPFTEAILAAAMAQALKK